MSFSFFLRWLAVDIPKLNSLNTCVIVELLRFLISDLCSSGTFP